MGSVLDAEEFQAGVQTGVAALLLAVVLGIVWHAWRHRRLPAGGLLFATAGLLALEQHLDLRDEVPIGVGLLALAGLTGDVFHTPLALRALLSLPGAWLLGFGTEVAIVDWVPYAVTATIVVGGTAASDLDRRWRDPSVACGLLAITVIGVYLTVPDTEAPLSLLVPAVLLALVAWPAGRLRMGSGGSYAAVGLLAWATAFGGIGRVGSIVGGLASLGLLLVEPAARVIARFRGPLLPRPGFGAVVVVGTAQAALVLVTSRVAGFRRDGADAALLAGVALVGATIVAVLAARRARQVGADMLPSADTR